MRVREFEEFVLVRVLCVCIIMCVYVFIALKKCFARQEFIFSLEATSSKMFSSPPSGLMMTNVPLITRSCRLSRRLVGVDLLDYRLELGRNPRGAYR